MARVGGSPPCDRDGWRGRCGRDGERSADGEPGGHFAAAALPRGDRRAIRLAFSRGGADAQHRRHDHLVDRNRIPLLAVGKRSARRTRRRVVRRDSVFVRGSGQVLSRRRDQVLPVRHARRVGAAVRARRRHPRQERQLRVRRRGAERVDVSRAGVSAHDLGGHRLGHRHRLARRLRLQGGSVGHEQGEAPGLRRPRAAHRRLDRAPRRRDVGCHA